MYNMQCIIHNMYYIWYLNILLIVDTLGGSRSKYLALFNKKWFIEKIKS